MANLITEGFDWFPSGRTEDQRETLWGANTMYHDNNHSLYWSIPDVTTGRFNFGKAMYYNWTYAGTPTGGRNGYIIPTGTDDDELVVGFAVYRDSDTSQHIAPTVTLFDAVNHLPQVSIAFDRSGIIRVYSGWPYQGNPIASSRVGSFEEDSWFHCEVKALIADSGGYVQVRINTVIKVDLVSADTQGSTRSVIDSIWMGFSHTGFSNPNSVLCKCAYDDLMVNDLTGTTMNDWAGNLRVKTQFMIADGFINDFSIGGTSPAATNWQSVLNQNMDDTKYVFSPNVGDMDLYTPDPNLNSPIVRVLQVRMGLRQDDSTQRVARAVIRLGGTIYEDDVDQYTNQSYTFYKGKWELNPATGVTFTGAEVNGLQPGVKVQA